MGYRGDRLDRGIDKVPIRDSECVNNSVLLLDLKTLIQTSGPIQHRECQLNFIYGLASIPEIELKCDCEGFGRAVFFSK